MENIYYDFVVTFTFVESVNLGKYFVDVLEETYGEKNVKKIDQSTYGINTKTVVDMDCVLWLLSKAEEKGERCKDGSELSIMTALDVKQQIISRRLLFQSRLNKVK